MHVGISLLTLSPGEQGGAETYARELLGALADVGTAKYTAFVPEAYARRSRSHPTRSPSAHRGSGTGAR